MTRRLFLPLILLVAFAMPATALANTVGNATPTVHGPKKLANKEWTASATLKASKAEALQLQVCLQSKKKTIQASLHHGAQHRQDSDGDEQRGQGVLASHLGLADVDGKTTTAVS